MNTKTAAELYQRASVENAPPLQIVRMLYQGLLRFLTLAEKADPTKNPRGFDENLRNADAILTELRRSLNHDVSPEFAETLDSLYLFCEAQMAKAMIEKTREPLTSARGVLTRLLEGWNAIGVGAAGGGDDECETSSNA